MKSVRKILLAVVITAAAGCSFAKPHPAANADTSKIIDRHLSGFSSIKIAGPFDVRLTQGDNESVKFEAPGDIPEDQIITEVAGGVLKIHNEHKNWGLSDYSWYGDKSIWRNHKKIVVYITATDLDAITVSGSGDMIFDEGLKAGSLRLLVRGSGAIQGKIEVKSLEGHISGSGEMKLSGSAGNSNVLVRGSGNFMARGLICANAAVHVSGSGSAEVNASDKVDAAVRGSGVISYSAIAKIINSRKSGSGEIRSF